MFTKILTNREKSYLRRVEAFRKANGPVFNLVNVTSDGTPHKCECCGKPDILQLFSVKNSVGQYFIIGSECQRHVLDITAAWLPAAVIREDLTARELFYLGRKYGVKGITQVKALAEAIIKARRSQANKTGHVSRRVSKGQMKALAPLNA